MTEEKIIDIERLIQDAHNFNKGTESGQQLMERSFKELGAGRSVLIDKSGNIIAGNKSQKAAIAAGIKKVRVIETTGDELVAVKRTDIDIDSKEGRKLALLDNLTQQVNLTWDKAELDSVDIDGFDAAGFGFNPEDLPNVLELTAGEKAPQTDAADDDDDTTPTSTSEFKYESQYGVIVMCSSEEEQEKVYNKLTGEGFSCKVVSV